MNLEHVVNVVGLSFFGGFGHLVGLVEVSVDQGCVECVVVLVVVGAGDA